MKKLWIRKSWPSITTGFGAQAWSMSEFHHSTPTPCLRCQVIYDQDCKYCHGTSEAKIIQIDSLRISKAETDNEGVTS